MGKLQSATMFIPLIIVLSSCISGAGVNSSVDQASATGALSVTGPASGTALPSTLPPSKSTNAPTITSPPTATTTLTPMPSPIIFDGARAFGYLLDQMEMGPRWPGSPGHSAAGNLIVTQLRDLNWSVEEQKFDYQGVVARNIIGRANEGAGPVVILGAHYDTRKIADRTEGSNAPVPGAVDGASGVAVLLELARSLDLDSIEAELWLAFFDVEDNGRGGIPGFDWIAGSTYMADNLTIVPQAVIVVDMIGDADQQLYYEGNSDPVLQAELWHIAADLGYAEQFIPELRHTMIDDHLPFAARGIPAVDIIDFDYAYWHTVEDTADKASAESLLRVGRTVEVWLEDHFGG